MNKIKYILIIIGSMSLLWGLLIYFDDPNRWWSKASIILSVVGLDILLTGVILGKDKK